MSLSPLTLLSEEQKEINLWARQGLTTYFSWYTVFLTFNGAVLGFSIAYNITNKEVLMLCLCGAFLIWNMFGIAAAGYTVKMMKEADGRITTINHLLKEELKSEPKFALHSPIPARLIRRALFLTMASMCILLFVWVAFTVKFANMPNGPDPRFLHDIQTRRLSDGGPGNHQNPQPSACL